METGDYLDTNNFTIYNGATDFQGLGGGYDAYGKLAQVRILLCLRVLVWAPTPECA